jgi:creatinine amidohydrolase/Fe(II)-dependent formamide hydrolase-like protein
MNTRQIRSLDPQKTVVLIPGGILEEHGPYLPSYTDGYADEAYARELANAIVTRPGWTVVMFPQSLWSARR